MTTDKSFAKPEDPLHEKRKQCLLCPLPNDFLRILPYHEDLYARGAVSRTDRYLDVAIIEARLVKNYGLVSMNPYCRLRLGDARFETYAAVNSSKHPTWNQACSLPLRNDTDVLSVVIMDEGFVLSDSKIAWTTIPLPQSLLDGTRLDMWYDLTGKQGQGEEGSIHLVMHVRTKLQLVPGYRGGTSTISVPGQALAQPPSSVPTPAPERVEAPPTKQVTAEDIQAIKEVFPLIEDDTIQTLLETHGGNRDEVTGELLRMTTET